MAKRTGVQPQKALNIGVMRDLSPFNVGLSSLTRGLAIIGQSGCGKSFLLGRFVEELIRVTSNKTRIVVIDMNSDFSKGLALKPVSAVKRIARGYRSADAEEQFTKFLSLEMKYYRQLKKRNTVGEVIGGKKPAYLDMDHLIESSTRFCDIIRANHMPVDYQMAVSASTLVLRRLRRRDRAFTLFQTLLRIMEYRKGLRNWKALFMGYPPQEGGWEARRIKNYLKHVSDETLISLLNDINQMSISGLWSRSRMSVTVPTDVLSRGRVAILELEGIPDPVDRSRIVTLLLQEIIEQSSKIVNQSSLAGDNQNEPTSRPTRSKYKHTFIVIDEAQNLAPDEARGPHDRRLGELLHRIAAEGRKYGLHLILGTQRPNKLKKGLLGELDNAVIMKMNSRSDLEWLASAMRILDVKLLEPTLHFYGKGNAIAIGEMTGMAPYSVQFKSAPRRTVEGGGDIKGF
jgi:hypothetical protein